ncbi:hypothetical protein [Actinoallomurus iriomotensis]|uniref:Uncharacterized protein n=1 Tax=Actinoallomurus iriomotensis TaxID=478107 RepID=A0A9W6RG02_9ACTN|nr:hypothetical protein [Actinoallomurus iriomotensis]GLY74894.1 hypothetical protein Airi01_031610 [Actinoallomurus iriomotensis]
MRRSRWFLRLMLTAVLTWPGMAVLGSTADASSRPRPLTASQQKSRVLRQSGLLPRRAGSALPAGGFGNGVFQVYVTPARSVGAGEFTVMTGASNPAGAGLDVLFGQGVPGTSYMIIRDVTAGVDYVQGQMLTHGNEVSLDDSSIGQSTTGTTTTTTWSRSSLFVEQAVSVTGGTVADTRVSVTTSITDYNTPKHQYKIQYLWDTEIGTDDGPAIQPRAAGEPYRPFDPTVGVERTDAPATGDTAVVDNDVNPLTPSLAVALSGSGDPQAVPDSVKYVCWPDAIFAPLGGYVTDGTRDVSGSASDCLGGQGKADSAVEYVWSADANQAGPQVTASLRMSPPAAYATTMRAGSISLGSATATLTDTATGKPIAGRHVRFSAGSRTLCDVTTDAAGHATCGGLLGGLLGYDVSFAGDAIWAPSTAHGGLLLRDGRPVH